MLSLPNAKKSFYLYQIQAIVVKINNQKNFISNQNNYKSKYQIEEEKNNILDEFTSKLMQNKSKKWANRHILAQKNYQNNLISSRDSSQLEETSVISLSTIEIDWLFQKAIDFDDNSKLIELTKQCIKYSRCPSFSLLLQALSICSQNGDKTTIEEIIILCEKLRPDILQKNSNLEHYLAEAIWIKGNITKSLKIFEKVYKENNYLRRIIRFSLRRLIQNVVTDKSAASLVNLILFSERLAKEYGDYFFLACVWEVCFLSDWFTDQQLALELLDKHVKLIEAVLARIPYVVNISLKNHRTETVYCLTETLLKFKIESELTQVLLALLDYFIKLSDIRRCKELIEWSLKHDINLATVIRNEKIINMLLIDQSLVKVKLKPDSSKKLLTEYKF